MGIDARSVWGSDAFWPKSEASAWFLGNLLAAE